MANKEDKKTAQLKTAQLKTARQRATKAMTAWQSNYDQALSDIKFSAGEQWSEAAKKEREGRPTLTLNKLSQYVNRVVGDRKQNTQSIKIHATDSDTAESKVQNATGKKDYSTAEVYDGVIRNIQLASKANRHYNTAYKHAVDGGIGWLRVLTDYISPTSFDQDIKIECIRNRFSVLIDPTAKEPDYSDANYAFIYEDMTKEDFDKKYPNKQVGELDGYNTDEQAFWMYEDKIRVSEYFTREQVSRELCLMTNGETHWKDEIEDVIDDLAQEGIIVQRTRKVKTHRVKWQKITAWDVLEETEWAGTIIPIIPVLGRETNIGDKREFRSLIYDGIDAQLMHNYWQSAATEKVALAPKAPWIVDVKSIQGHENTWSTVNTENHPYLPYNSTANAVAPKRENPTPMPAAELQIAQLSEEGIKSSIGIYDAGLGQRSNETSGKAILARQSQSNTGTYDFVDSMEMAIEKVGSILVEIIPRIYDSNRLVRMGFADGSGDFVEINKTVTDEQTGKEVIVNDLGVGTYDVTVSTGASYSSQRQEAAENTLEFMRAVPKAAELAPDIVARNLDFPDADTLADRLKKTLPPQLLTEEEREELQEDAPPPPEPTPEQKLEAQKAEFEMQKEKLAVDLQTLKVKEAEINLQTAGMDVQEIVKETVAQAMAEILANKS